MIITIIISCNKITPIKSEFAVKTSKVSKLKLSTKICREYFIKIKKHVCKKLLNCVKYENCKLTAEKLSTIAELKNIYYEIIKDIIFYLNNIENKYNKNNLFLFYNKDHINYENKKLEKILLKEIEINPNEFKNKSTLINIIKKHKELNYYIYSSDNYRYINWKAKSFNFIKTAKQFNVINKTQDNYFKISNYYEYYNKTLRNIEIIINKITFNLYMYGNEVSNSNIIYRGTVLSISNPIVEYNKDIINKLIVTLNPLSFSFDKEVAKFYMKNYDKSLVSVLFIIDNSNKLCLGKNLNNNRTTKFDSEEEFLLRQYTYLIIKNIQSKNNYKEIELECKENYNEIFNEMNKFNYGYNIYDSKLYSI